MKKLVFKNLLIADIGNRKAKSVTFAVGKNLLTSHANHLGKSLICKSLYYSLGAESFFSDAWKNENSMYILQFAIDDQTYTIARKNKLFTLWGENGQLEKFYMIKNLQKRLNQIFDFHIMLIGKNENKSLIDSAPVFMYIPYYIDQEYGWTPETKSFDKLAQFDQEERRNALYYHIGCLDENYVNVALRLDEANIQLSNLEKEKTTCTEIIKYMEKVLSDNGDAVIYNESELTKKIDDNRHQLSQTLKEIEQKRNEILKLENEHTKLLQDKESIEVFLKKRQKPINKTVECPVCSSQIVVNFAETFQKEYIKETIHDELSDLVLRIRKLEDKINSKEIGYFNLSSQFKYIEHTISTDQDIYDKYIKMRSTKEMLIENQRHLGEIDTQIEKIKRIIKQYQASKKAYDESKKTANDVYQNNLSTLFAQLNISTREVNPYECKIGENIQASGAYKDRVILAKYYALLLTKKYFNKDIIDFPLVIDSPRGDEQDKENAKIIMDFILNNTDITNQVIVATIDGQDYVSTDYSPNIIELVNKPHELLSNKEYVQNEALIEKCLLNF